jgi:dTMP kinase
MFICIEGMDGVGKSSVIDRIIGEWDGPVNSLHDPGVHVDHKVGQSLRQIVKYNEMDAEAETFLFMACRKELVAEINRLGDEGIDVIVDRYKASTYVYQGIIKDQVELVEKLDEICDFPVPDLTIYLTAPFDVLTERLIKRNANIDKFKSNESFRRRVWSAYKGFIANDLYENPNAVSIDASGTPEEVYDLVNRAISKYKETVNV